MLINIDIEAAQELLLNNILPLPSEQIPLSEALGRVIADDFTAPANLPAYPQAAVDGFAVHLKDMGSGQLRIVKLSKDIQNTVVYPGETVAVLTGRPIPQNTGAVVPQEHTEVRENEVFFLKDIIPGNNIKVLGEDFEKGDLLADRGTVVGPGLIGVFAAFGKDVVKVYRQPRIAVLSLADEIVPYNTIDPEFNQIRDCNGPLISSLACVVGGKVQEIGYTQGCSMEEVEDMVKRILLKADLLVTLGRTASGNDDYALSLLRGLGAKILFWGVGIKPGSHSGGALLDSKPVIALSGNAAAGAVGFQLLAVPVIKRLRGMLGCLEKYKAVIEGAFNKKGGPRRFLRGNAYLGDKGLMVELLSGQKSSMLRSLIGCNALIDLPAGHSPVETGSEVSVILLSDFSRKIV
ncbi:MAG: molybdopterin molybdotransferase MoeA [Peptococcaceae bacterium]|nr:molybdopterin molybdotransferase MoeA [Peptococcaceae bacterium]